MTEPVTFEFEATAKGTFVRHFEDEKEARDWLEGLSDGDIQTEIEAASGWKINMFTAKREE